MTATHEPLGFVSALHCQACREYADELQHETRVLRAIDGGKAEPVRELAECAHCDDGDGCGPDSMDYGQRVPCPACNEPICPSCRAMSTPTDCMHAFDDSALATRSTLEI